MSKYVIHERSRAHAMKRRWLIIIGSGALGLVLVVGALYWFVWRSTEEPVVAKADTSQVADQPSNDTSASASTIEGRYLFSGTIAWDRAIERDAKTDYSRPFSQLNTFDRSKYDAWIADLECPSTSDVVPYQTQVDSLIFNCPTQFNAEARKFFDIIGLSNNHTYDMGRSGFLETQKNLAAAGFQTYGSYEMSDTPNLCEVIALPIKLKNSDGQAESANIPVAFCGYHAVSGYPTQDELDLIKEYSKVMPVFAFAHIGIEYTPVANEQQRTLARAFIDNGAEFVIMNHPHWVQDTDVYKGKLIVYSTGNLIYDQLNYDEQRSASYDIKLTANYDDNMAAWIKYASTCQATKLNDDCFANLPANLVKPTFSYVYDMVAGSERPPQRWLARKADNVMQLDTEQRTNWLDTLRRLGQTERLN